MQYMAPATHISINQLNRLVGTHNSPVLLDVRTDEDFNLDPQRLPAAIRCAFTDVTSLVPSLQHSNVVVCRDAVDEGHDWPTTTKP